MVLEDSFGAQSVLQDFLSLIMRHWNVIADTLHSGDVFLPLLLEDENGISHANDWAKGFLPGMERSSTTIAKFCSTDSWQRLPFSLPPRARARRRRIPARSDADRPAPAGSAALRLLADVDISFWRNCCSQDSGSVRRWRSSAGRGQGGTGSSTTIAKFCSTDSGPSQRGFRSGVSAPSTR